jgi:hypothetical protein
MTLKCSGALNHETYLTIGTTSRKEIVYLSRPQKFTPEHFNVILYFAGMENVGLCMGRCSYCVVANVLRIQIG